MHIHFDCFSGVSGNMVLGALLDMGVPREALETPLRTLPLGGWELDVREVHRGPLRATWCGVITPDAPAPCAGQEAACAAHGHASGHGGAHAHEHAAGGGHAHRSFADIAELIAAAELPARARDLARCVFSRLAEAEGRVHGVPPCAVTFHEVGAVDSIIDIVGTCLGLVACDATRITCAPLVVGSGSVMSRHGSIPLPAPATAELLAGVPVRQVDCGFELTTPTGAALMTVLAEQFCSLPDMIVAKTAYGAGDDRPSPLPNVLRVFAGKAAPASEPLLCLETNIDNAPAEDLALVLDRLMEEGALDAFFTPVIMKKSRPAALLTCLCREADRMRLEDLVLAHLPTLGIRAYRVDRRARDRRVVSVPTRWGPVRIKEAVDGAHVAHASPEYEDLRRIAAAHAVGIGRVRREVMAAYASHVSS